MATGGRTLPQGHDAKALSVIESITSPPDSTFGKVIHHIDSTPNKFYPYRIFKAVNIRCLTTPNPPP